MCVFRVRLKDCAYICIIKFSSIWPKLVEIVLIIQIYIFFAHFNAVLSYHPSSLHSDVPSYNHQCLVQLLGSISSQVLTIKEYIYIYKCDISTGTFIKSSIIEGFCSLYWLHMLFRLVHVILPWQGIGRSRSMTMIKLYLTQYTWSRVDLIKNL